MRLVLEAAEFRRSEDIDVEYEEFIKTLKSCVEEAEVKVTKRRKGHISEATRALMQERKLFKRSGVHNVEYSLLCKAIRIKLKEDIRKFKTELRLKTAEWSRSIKKCVRSLVLYRNDLKALRDKSGALVKSRERMEEIRRNFYSELFSSMANVPSPTLPPSSEPPSPIIVSEIRSAIQEIEAGKAPEKMESPQKHLRRVVTSFGRSLEVCSVDT